MACGVACEFNCDCDCACSDIRPVNEEEDKGPLKEKKFLVSLLRCNQLALLWPVFSTFPAVVPDRADDDDEVFGSP